jgi:hypothetical protein
VTHNRATDSSSTALRLPPSAVGLAPEDVSAEVEKYTQKSGRRPVVRILGQTAEFPYAEKIPPSTMGAVKDNTIWLFTANLKTRVITHENASIEVILTLHRTAVTPELFSMGENSQVCFSSKPFLQPRLATRDRNKEIPLHLACQSASPSCGILYQRENR